MQFIERLLEATDDCIEVLDTSGRILAINPNGLEALEIADFESIRGRNWLDLWSGDDRIAAIEAVDVARRGERGRFTGRIEIARVERFWDVSIVAMIGSNGEPDRLLAVSRDISDTAIAMRELAHGRERDLLLAASLPGVTWTATADGMLDTIAHSVASTERGPIESRLGAGWLQNVHPDDRERARARWAASVASGEPYEATFRVRLADGSYPWQLVRALPQRDDAGRISRWVGVNIDIDERVRADEAREMFVALAENSGDLVAIADRDGTHLYMNPAGRELVGIADAGARTLFDLFLEDDAAYLRSIVLPAVAREGRWSGDLQIADSRTGKAIPIGYNAFELASEDGRRLAIAMIGRDLRGRRRLESNMRALAETGAAMHGSLDFEDTIANVADAVVLSFASYCIVDAYDASGERRSAAAAQHDVEAIPVLEEIAEARKRLPNHPSARAIERGESTLVASVSTQWLDATGVRTSVGTTMDRFDFRSIIFVPIRSSRDGRLLGSLTYVRDGDDPRGLYTADDLRFGEEIARRAGTAFDNASAFEHERRIAVTLQKASLPRELPAFDDLQLSAAYRPGDSEATIGGDWYDAFALPDGRLVITIGDVLGHGLDAAVTMGKVRQAMQSVAMVTDDLDTILAAADRTVRAQSAETYATALVGIFDRARHEFRFASAGHPGPILRHADGRVEELGADGIMLGLRPTAPQLATTVSAPLGSTLVFFTDGLVEATRDIDAGNARLRAAVADSRFTNASKDANVENIARTLVERVLGGVTASDDIAVLVAHVGPSVRATGSDASTPDARLERPLRAIDDRVVRGRSRQVDGRMVLVVIAKHEEVSRSRGAIRDMLAESRAPRAAVALGEIAAGELIANAVNHGDGSTIEVRLQTLDDRAILEVINSGPIFAASKSSLGDMLLEEHGRGLALLAAFGCALEISAPETGRCMVTATIPFGDGV